MRRAEIGWGSLMTVILFMVGAALIIIFLMDFVPDLQTGFEDTICQMSAWMRASTLGSPLMQSLMGVGGFLTSGFSTMTTSVSMPLACKPGPSINAEQPVSLEELLDKVGRESVRCWGNMGQGAWDPLVMYSEGQSFKCYEELINVSCNQEELNNIGVTANNHLTKNGLLNYFRVTEAGYSGFNMTFLSILNQEHLFYNPTTNFNLTCDATERQMLIGVYFVDSFTGGGQETQFVPIPCQTIDVGAIGTDIIVLCTWDLTGQEVII